MRCAAQARHGAASGGGGGDADSVRMALWLAVGWCTGAVALAALLHRLQRTRRARGALIEAFRKALAVELARHEDAVLVGMLPGRFSGLVRVRGQDTAVSLGELFRRWLAFPEGFAGVVDRLVGEIEESALDRLEHHEFGGVSTDLMPQVRSRAWVEARGRFGDSALVTRDWGSDLAIVYVVDDPDTMTYVCRAHLKHWHRSAEDVHQLALQNLRRRAGNAAEAFASANAPILLQTGDGYDAARALLLPDEPPTLVAMPDRDVLWIARDEGQDVEDLQHKAHTMCAAAAHPISDRIYRLSADGPVEAVRGD